MYCIMLLFIKIQLTTLTRYIHPIVLHYHVFNMFWLIPSHHQGDKYNGPCIREYAHSLVQRSLKKYA
jgi:hypothetical protein